MKAVCPTCQTSGIDKTGIMVSDPTKDQYTCHFCGTQSYMPHDSKVPVVELIRPPVLIGVGMPASLYLDEFGSQVWSAFGTPPYLVGSALFNKQWRDVDVRLILDDADYELWGLGDPKSTHSNPKWVSLCMAYAALGKSLTGLPIDFQIQQQTTANAMFRGPRNTLGIIGLRFAKD